MKYPGVATPFSGECEYAPCAMGTTESETALEELMCGLLGDLLTEGVFANLADGGNTHEELLRNWKLVLQDLHKYNLCLSAYLIDYHPC